MSCHLNEKEPLTFTLSYDTLVELVASASQAAGYLNTLGKQAMKYPYARDISERLRAALEAVTR